MIDRQGIQKRPWWLPQASVEPSTSGSSNPARARLQALGYHLEVPRAGCFGRTSTPSTAAL